jgi:DnaK suppressor protein
MLRELLTRLRKEAQQRIKDLRKDQEQESDSGVADEMDSASTTEEIETHAGLIARAEEKLRYLDEAFARLDAGKYGRCLKCGGAIPIERLMAIPFASYCVNCQQGSIAPEEAGVKEPPLRRSITNGPCLRKWRPRRNANIRAPIPRNS